jgi:transposase
LGCHNPCVPDHDAMDAIVLVLCTGMQWNALSATGICHSSSAHRRFQEWQRPGVFREIWRQGLLDYDREVGTGWSWLAADGAMAKAPLGGGQAGPDPTDRAKRAKRGTHRSRRRPDRDRPRRRQPPRQEAPGGDAGFGPDRPPDPDEDHPKGLCLDRGYDCDDIRELVLEQRFEPLIRTRGEEIEPKERHPDRRARRWVVEACHSWLNRNRALLIRWSKKPDNHHALLQLASGLIALEKARSARLATAAGTP